MQISSISDVWVKGKSLMRENNPDFNRLVIFLTTILLEKYDRSITKELSVQKTKMMCQN